MNAVRPATTTAEDWRHRCPNGHTSYEYRTGQRQYHCQTCGVVFDEPVDTAEEGVSFR
jgi:hypothetical protein